jgi:two-component system response regulator DctR
MPYWLPEELDQTLTAHYAVLAGTAPRDGFELRFQRKDGTRFDALIYEAPLIDADGKQRGWMGLNPRRHRAQARGGDQPPAPGEAAADLAPGDDGRACLLDRARAEPAAGGDRQLQCRLPQPGARRPDRRSEFAQALEKLGQQAQRAGQIIRSVYDFVRKTEPKMAPVRLADVVETSVGLVATEARRRRVPIVVLDEHMAESVMADRVMLEQVLVNLTRNALDAMHETPVEERRIVVSAALDGEFVTVAVADKGGGVPDDLAEKLFSPFFSTKTEGNGHGPQHLPLDHRVPPGPPVVRAERGRRLGLQVHPAPGRGMTDATVFIVDDDEAIRDSLRWMLKSRGVASQSWDSAESFLAAYGEAMHGCLVLDIRMDGMSGLDLFDRLNELKCRLPVIFLTGHADVPMAVAALKKGAHDFVEKPFNDNELVDKIDGALAKAAILRDRSVAAQSLSHRLATLSQREREVMDLILAGKANKVIADDLNIAMRTVEVHRAHVLEKMGVRTALELSQLLAGQTRE